LINPRAFPTTRSYLWTRAVGFLMLFRLSYLSVHHLNLSWSAAV
jgi:hypothetical protein